MLSVLGTQTQPVYVVDFLPHYPTQSQEKASFNKTTL